MTSITSSFSSHTILKSFVLSDDKKSATVQLSKEDQIHKFRLTFQIPTGLENCIDFQSRTVEDWNLVATKIGDIFQHTDASFDLLQQSKIKVKFSGIHSANQVIAHNRQTGADFFQILNTIVCGKPAEKILQVFDNKKITSLENQIERLKKELSEKTKELTDLESKKLGLEKQVAQSKEEIQSLKTRNDQLQTEIGEGKNKLTSLIKVFDEKATTQFDLISQKLEPALKKITELNKKIAESSQQLKNLQSQGSKASHEIAGYIDSLGKLGAEFKASKEELLTVKDEHAIAVKELEELKKQISSQQERIQLLESEKAGLKKNLLEAEERLKNAESKLLISNDELEKLKKEIQDLKSVQNQSTESLTHEKDLALTRAAVAEKKLGEADQDLEALNKKISNKETELESAKGLLNEALKEAETLKASLGTKQKEVQKQIIFLQDGMKNLQKEIDGIKPQLEILKKEKANNEKQISDLEARVSQLLSANDTQRKELNAHTEILKNADVRLDQVKSAKERYAAQLKITNDCKAEIEKLNTELGGLRSDKESLTHKINELNEKIVTLNTLGIEKQKLLDEANCKISSLKELIAQKDSEFQALQKEKENISDELQKLRDTFEKCKIQEINKKISELKDILDCVKKLEKSHERQAKIAKIQSEINTLQSTKNQNEADRKVRQEELIKKENEIVSIDQKISVLKVKIEALGHYKPELLSNNGTPAFSETLDVNEITKVLKEFEPNFDENSPSNQKHKDLVDLTHHLTTLEYQKKQYTETIEKLKEQIKLFESPCSINSKKLERLNGELTQLQSTSQDNEIETPTHLGSNNNSLEELENVAYRLKFEIDNKLSSIHESLTSIHPLSNNDIFNVDNLSMLTSRVASQNLLLELQRTTLDDISTENRTLAGKLKRKELEIQKLTENKNEIFKKFSLKLFDFAEKLKKENDDHKNAIQYLRNKHKQAKRQQEKTIEALGVDKSKLGDIIDTLKLRLDNLRVITKEQFAKNSKLDETVETLKKELSELATGKTVTATLQQRALEGKELEKSQLETLLKNNLEIFAKAGITCAPIEITYSKLKNISLKLLNFYFAELKILEEIVIQSQKEFDKKSEFTLFFEEGNPLLVKKFEEMKNLIDNDCSYTKDGVLEKIQDNHSARIEFIDKILPKHIEWVKQYVELNGLVEMLIDVERQEEEIKTALSEFFDSNEEILKRLKLSYPEVINTESLKDIAKTILTSYKKKYDALAGLIGRAHGENSVIPNKFLEVAKVLMLFDNRYTQLNNLIAEVDKSNPLKIIQEPLPSCLSLYVEFLTEFQGLNKEIMSRQSSSNKSPSKLERAYSFAYMAKKAKIDGTENLKKRNSINDLGSLVETKA